MLVTAQVPRLIARALCWLVGACLATLLAACGDVGLHGPLPSDGVGEDLFVPMFFGMQGATFTQNGEPPSAGDTSTPTFSILSVGDNITLLMTSGEEHAPLFFRVIQKLSPTGYLVHYANGMFSGDGTGCIIDIDPQPMEACATLADGKLTVERHDSVVNYAILDLLPDGGIRLAAIVDADQKTLASVLRVGGIALNVDDKKAITQNLRQAETGARLYTAISKVVAASLADAKSTSVIRWEFHPGGPDAQLLAAANVAAWRGDVDRAVAITKTLADPTDAAVAYTLGELFRRGTASGKDCADGAALLRLAAPLGPVLQSSFAYAKAGQQIYGSYRRVYDDVRRAGIPPCTGTGAGPSINASTNLGTGDAAPDATPLKAVVADAGPSPVGLPVRRALLIGMSGYTDPKLMVPGNRTQQDAIAVADVLRGINGYVEPTIMAPDADKFAFDTTFAKFVESVKQGDQVLLFYSGHGIEYRGDNYLLLRDAKGVMPKDDFSIKSLLSITATSLRDMIKALKARGPSNIIVVLNACRNITDPNLGAGDGDFDFSPPARMASEPGVGTIFATTSDTFAEVCLGDCDADKSPYTVFARRFIEKLRTPNLSVRRLVDEVTAEVADDVRTSNGRVQMVDYHDQTADPLNRDRLYIGPVVGGAPDKNAGIEIVPQPQPQPQPEPQPRPDPTPAPNAAAAARAVEACRLAAAPPLLFERIETTSAIASCMAAVALNPTSADAESWLGRAYDAATDYATAAEHYQVAADAGAALAQHNLANLYRKGQGVGIDPGEAYRLYKLAADQEFPQSFASLAEFYERGEVVARDLDEARRLYQLAANRGIARGVDGVARLDTLLAADATSTRCADLAAPNETAGAIDVSAAEPACREAIAASPDDADLKFYLGRVLNEAGRATDAAAMFRQAADAGQPGAQNMLGRMHLTGNGVEKDEKAAFALFEQAAAQGDVDAQINLADGYLNGIGTTQDMAKAASIYGDAMANGSKVAAFWLANLNLFGSGVPQDYAEAKRLYEQARSDGIVASAIGLGLIYENGYGVPVDYAAALAQYEDAASNGNSAGNFHLGKLYEQGLGVPASLTSARGYYAKAADAGDADGKAALERIGDPGLEELALCRSLAAMRIAGAGVATGAIDVATAEPACQAALAARPDDPEAQFLAGRVYIAGERDTEGVALYIRSAGLGYAPAQSNLGAFYINGTGVAQDLDKGRELYLAASEQGYALAKTNLGFLYAQGKGVTQDDTEALRYFTEAAKLGSAQANLELGNIYLVGRGVAVDYVAAAENYRAGWNEGLSPGAVGLGIIYESGLGVVADYAAARGFYEAASRAGNPEGTYYVGRLYENGRGVTKDLKKARSLYQSAADGGNSAAKEALARLGKQSDAGDTLLEQCRAAAAPRVGGHGVHFDNIDTAVAEPPCRAALAAATGSAERQFLLARVLDRMENYDEAAPLYTSAAAQRYAPAQSSLGVLHLYGRGVAADHARARQLFEQAAAQGDAAGLSNLGLANELGYGKPINLTAARGFYEKAMAAGLAVASLHLGSMYFEGRGVPKDSGKSATLMNLALDDGVTVETAAWGAH